MNIEKATKEVNCLKMAAESLKSELEREKSTLESVKQREGMASVAVASLEADLEHMRVEINRVQVIKPSFIYFCFNLTLTSLGLSL